jgi:HD-GYP domain-containing protein (c-di-GMP phosphodiesterase class II)
LSGDQIPLVARVLQVADIYDALTSPRPYKPAVSSETAIEIIKDETARGWRDPEIIDVFLQVHQDVVSKMLVLPEDEVAGKSAASASLDNLRAQLRMDYLPYPAA